MVNCGEAMPTPSAIVWLLLDDRAGNASQVRGVAEALASRLPGLDSVEQHIRYTALGGLPNVVRGATLMGVAEASAAQLMAPWPDVVISAGRRTAPVARWIAKVARKASGAKHVILAHIMNPGRVGATEFDLIAVPNHDCKLPGGDAANVLRVVGAPHRYSSARLAAEAATWRPRFAHLPRPLIALLVGGATHQRPFPTALATELGARVAAMASAAGGSVLLTTSRRTGPAAEAALTAALQGVPTHLYVWGREAAAVSTVAGNPADNPYGGYLALADAVVVTGDSASMCSEACAGTNAVYIAAPEGITAPKHARLHAELYARGAAKPFDGRLAPFTHAPVNAAEAIAARIVEMLTAR
jgi:hypothetical protein